MITAPQFDEHEFEQLYERLLYQHGNAFFCVTVGAPALQVALAEKMQGRFAAGDVQVIDFSKVDAQYSSALLRTLIMDGVKYVFLANFHLANGHGVDDAMFFQILNLSRDALAELPVALVFMMPMSFRVQIAQNASDFNSFFIYRADFAGEERGAELPEVNWSEPYCEANRELLEYYVERYHGMTEFDSRRVFDTLTMILALNDSVHMLSGAEQSRLYENFCRLLPLYRDEPDIKLGDIAQVFGSQGDYDAEREWHLKNLFVYEKILGTVHPVIATITNNIALTYEKQDNNIEALEWHQKALAMDENLHGKEHLDTATSYNNIAIVYGNQGDYKNALEFHLKALYIRGKLLSENHSSISQSCNNIGMVYAQMGDYAKALEWLYKALSISEIALGEEHPSNADSYNTIAWVYVHQGNYSKALELYLKSYLICIRKLGSLHHYTRRVRQSMELTYQFAALPQPFEEWLEQNLTPQHNHLQSLPLTPKT